MANLAKIKKTFSEKLELVLYSKDLEALKIEFLGKNGHIQEQMKKIGELAPDERKTFGAEINEVKEFITAAIEQKARLLQTLALQQKLESETIDITLPPYNYQAGKVHPLSQSILELQDIFSRLGFLSVDGPEIDDDWHNFTALNIPEHHPARQTHDTFYIEGGNLLRTHTSNMQIRHMMANKPPFKIITLGKTYRADDDATHTPMFHQLEGLYIDKGITMAHLKGCLEAFLSMFFGLKELPVRFRPSFFPFTEPSAEIDIRCDRSNKAEIKIGKGNDWVELLGSGMVHPNVLRNVGVDPEIYQGFAFGCGIERLTMLKYNIPDLRTFYAGDIRWLKHYGI